MKIHHNLLQIYVTVLTAIIGVALSQPSSTMFLLLIPIESSIFGIWYFDIAITMLEIGTYIRDRIKTKIQTDFNDKCILGWEDYFNGGKGHNFKETAAFKPYWRHAISLGIVLVTFGLPAAMPLPFFIYLWLQGNSIVENDIIIFLMITNFILLSAFVIAVGYYICKSLKIGKEYRNEKNTVANEIQQS
jgi:hypothetical protein